MSGVLFLAHRVPFPPDRGDKIRSHHVLKALADLGPVHVGCFAESVADRAAELDLGGIAATWCMPTRSKPLPTAGLEAIVRGKPVSLTAFHHPVLAEWVARTLERQEIDTIYVFSGQMGQYVPADWRGCLVVDLVDVDSAKFEAYGREKPFPMSWVDAREARLLRREEARLAAHADRTLLVSNAEAALFVSRLPAGTAASVTVLGNGIDATAFDPARTGPPLRAQFERAAFRLHRPDELQAERRCRAARDRADHAGNPPVATDGAVSRRRPRSCARAADS
jgi:polysaccharide biosynthesis protein PslH